MKNYFKLSMFVLSLVGLASCDMDAPAESALDEQGVFTSYVLAEQDVMGICQSFCETNSYRGRFLPYYGLNTDIEWMVKPSSTKVGDNDKNDLVGYNTSPSNKQMNTANNAYAMFYQGIERANLAIKGLRAYGGATPGTDMGQLLGEAITLRAVLYLDLIKGWGDVPYRFEPNNADNVYLPRQDRDTIYLRLLDDLKEAEDLCYWPKENKITSTTERVSKAFVKGLRARIALYAGGYSQRADGTIRLSGDPRLAPAEMYKIAAEECEDIINQGCNVLGTFEKNFKDLCLEDVTAGKESIYEIPFSPTRGRVMFTLGVEHHTKDKYTKQAHGGVNGPATTLWYDYDVEDVRRDITCVPYEWNNGAQYIEGVDNFDFGKLRYEWMTRVVDNDQDDGINWQYLRLADVYMMAAEAENELGNTSIAWTYLKPILDRALPAAKVSELQAKYTASQQAFREGIYDQRAFEFAGEMLRKADLIRWNIIDQKMAEAKTKLDQLRNREGVYSDLPEYIYYRNVGTDNETLEIYGMNHGDTDEKGQELLNSDQGWRTLQNSEGEPSKWLSTSSIKDEVINGIYYNTPSQHEYWPIWQVFIDGSNGYIDNSWLGY